MFVKADQFIDIFLNVAQVPIPKNYSSLMCNLAVNSTEMLFSISALQR